jgi:arsenate reductase-like glutaredoxin family protein
MRVYCLKTCDTCRKALKALDAAGIVYDLRDVRSDGIAAADLAAILAAHGEGAINRASTTWRGLSEAEKALPPVALLAAHPTLLKRPAIEAGGAWFLGWKPEVQAKVIG